METALVGPSARTPCRGRGRRPSPCKRTHKAWYQRLPIANRVVPSGSNTQTRTGTSSKAGVFTARRDIATVHTRRRTMQNLKKAIPHGERTRSFVLTGLTMAPPI